MMEQKYKKTGSENNSAEDLTQTITENQPAPPAEAVEPPQEEVAFKRNMNQKYEESTG